MTQAARHSRWSLLALAALWSLDAGAQLPAAPRVVIESNPSQQQARPQQQQTQTTAPAPAAAPVQNPQGLSAPTVTIQTNPGVTVPSPAAAPAPSRPVVMPAQPSAGFTVQSSPRPSAGVSSPAGAAAVAPTTVPTPDGIGTTIVGEQEAPIGLYITPWKDDYAERGLDRPARLLDEAMEPIDPATFRRQIEYYETITEYRRKQRGEAK
ncbi:MAG: hypothetical protein NTW01_01675 [Gammaproteobacteria bacterium]|uniref:hypothetical protein n=1 Tax=Nevskia sp. TaxID=1929292 RepID=UPI004035DA37|nr:hypothetical protein [Gammaproteobacteria bacterium]